MTGTSQNAAFRSPEPSSPLLEVGDLRMHFPVRGGVFMRPKGVCKAVDGVSFSLPRGQTLGLVGESGCGKSTLGKAIAGLYRPNTGFVRWEGKDLVPLTDRERLPYRRNLQMIFQDPAESLNPRMTVGEILEEPFIIHKIGDGVERRKSVLALLDRVGLPADSIHRFPFEFSGGQRQRIGIARAIALKPSLIICDEPVSALDVSIQGQVLNLLLELQREMGLSYLFIAHDLSVVKHMSDRVAVMYLGRIVEMAGAEEIYRAPKHLYTKALLSAVPVPDPDAPRNRIILPGDVPSPIDPPEGCAFAWRCGTPKAMQYAHRRPTLTEVEPGHWVDDCPFCLGELE